MEAHHGVRGDSGQVRGVELRDRPFFEVAAAWYEEQQPGLGVEFVRTVRRAIRTLPANPLIHRLRDRRRNVRWFLRRGSPIELLIECVAN